MTLRVLQVVDTLAPGGRERLVVDLANGHLRHGVEAHVCETRGRGDFADELDTAVRHLVLGRRRRLAPGAMFRLARYAVRQDIDVIHSHGRGVTQFVALVKALFRLDVPHLFHDHLPGVDVTSAAPLAMRLARRAIDGVIGVSPDLRSWAVECLVMPRNRVWYVLNSIDAQRFSAAKPVDLRAEFPEVRNAGSVFVATGNVRPQKDYETLIRALAHTAPCVAVVIVGSVDADPGYAHHCRALVRELGLAHRVVFAGTRRDVPDLLAGAMGGVLTSRMESGPLAVAEYAASGLLIVATATGPVTDALTGEPFAAVVPVGDFRAVADALDRLASATPAQRIQLGRTARDRAEALFGMDRMVAEVIGVYRELMAQLDRRRTSGHCAGRLL